MQQYKDSCKNCGLILMTGSSRAAIDTYAYHPTALVPEPLTYGGLERAMTACFAYWRHGLRWLEVSLQHRRVRLPLYQTYFAEAAGRNTLLHRAEGVLQVNCSLSGLEEQLPAPPFLRCQKSFIVHLGAVRRIAGGELVMCNGRAISVARKRMRLVQDAWQDYWKLRGMEETIKWS